MPIVPQSSIVLFLTSRGEHIIYLRVLLSNSMAPLLTTTHRRPLLLPLLTLACSRCCCANLPSLATSHSAGWPLLSRPCLRRTFTRDHVACLLVHRRGVGTDIHVIKGYEGPPRPCSMLVWRSSVSLCHTKFRGVPTIEFGTKMFRCMCSLRKG